MSSMLRSISERGGFEPLYNTLDEVNTIRDLLSGQNIATTLYVGNDGTEESFKESNQRFRRNGIKVAKIEFKWYDPRRYIVMFDAVKYATLCQLFGWSVWARERIKKARMIARALLSIIQNEHN